MSCLVMHKRVSFQVEREHMCTVPFHTGRIHVFEMNPGKIAENAIGGVRKRDSTGVIIRNKHFSLLLATNVKLIRV